MLHMNIPALILTGCGVSLCLMLVTSVSFSSSVSNVHSFNTLGSLGERGKEKGERREGEGREKGGRRKGKGRGVPVKHSYDSIPVWNYVTT